MLGAILLALAACAAPTDRALVGLWEAAPPGPTGVAHSLEFRADGGFVSSFTVSVQLAYRVDRGRLLTADDQAALERETDGPRVEIQGNVLALTDDKGRTLRKERVGPVEDASRPIVGVWRFKHDTGPMAYERYTAAGVFLFRLPMSSNAGCYAVSGNSLSVDAEGTRGTKFTSRLTGEELELTREGKSTRYRRAPSAWYPRE